MPRRWREGDIFTPHDLSGSEMRKWKKRSERTADVFDAAGVNPLDHYRVSFPLLPSFHCPFSSGNRIVGQSGDAVKVGG